MYKLLILLAIIAVEAILFAILTIEVVVLLNLAAIAIITPILMRNVAAPTVFYDKTIRVDRDQSFKYIVAFIAVIWFVCNFWPLIPFNAAAEQAYQFANYAQNAVNNIF